MASQAQTNDRLLMGIALRVATGGGYALMAALLKRASEHEPVGPTEMLFYRALFGILVVLAWVGPRTGFHVLRPNRWGAHVARSVLGMASILCTFQALIMLPLELAITIGFTAPAFATLLSAVLLGEPVGLRRWLAVAVGFAGIAIATRPGGAAWPLAGIAVAMLSALGQGGVTVTLRKLGQTEQPAAIVFWFFVISAIVGGLSLPFVGHGHSATGMGLLALAGLIGGIMQLMMTESLRLAPVSVTAPFDYMQIIWAVALGWALWGAAPAWTTLAGAALIAGSGLYTAWREHRLRRAVTPPVPVE